MRRHAVPLALIGTFSVFAGAYLERYHSPRVDESTTNITAFIGVTVVRMDSPRVLPEQIVLVRDDRILQIGPSNAIHVPLHAKRIEGHGFFLLPGLADMHVHLMEGDAYFPLFLASGVTTVRNMSGGPEMATVPNAVTAKRHLGPCKIVLDSFDNSLAVACKSLRHRIDPML